MLIDLLREYLPAKAWFDALPDDELVYVSGFVVMELLQGCRNKVEMERVRRLLANYGIAWLSPAECEKSLEVFAAFRLSHNAGLLDVLIGQTSVAMGTPLLTFNQRHYGFIPGISTIQPYKKRNQETS